MAVSVTVHVTYQDDDTPMMKVELATYPRKGEKIGVRPLPTSREGAAVYYLDTVVDVRQYPGTGDPGDMADLVQGLFSKGPRSAAYRAPEYHVLTSSRP